jgi:hypothetical protein
MQTKPKHTVVVIPDDKKIEVSYYCSDQKLRDKQRKEFADLIIQLNDCHSSVRINKKKARNPEDVEAIVQKTVINSRGHLCD